MVRRLASFAALTTSMTCGTLVACNAILGNDEPKLTDAGDAEGEGSPPDAQTDAVDVRLDAGADVDPDACVFCDDFEAARWSGRWAFQKAIPVDASVDANPLLEVDSGGFDSGYALYVRSTGTVSPGPQLQLEKLQGTSPNKAARFSFAVRIEETDPNVTACIALVGSQGVIGVHHLRVMLNSSNIYIQEYVTEKLFFEHLRRASPPRGVWSRVAVDIDFEPAPPMVKLTIDGVFLGEQKLGAALPPPSDNGIAVGIIFTGKDTVGTWRLAFDDVAFRLP